MCETKYVTTLWIPVFVVKKMSMFLLIHILYFKLYLMLKLNTPKDAACLGLSDDI